MEGILAATLQHVSGSQETWAEILCCAKAELTALQQGGQRWHSVILALLFWAPARAGAALA